MIVAELISILKGMDPSAVAVVSASNDIPDFHTVLELKSDRVHSVELRIVETTRTWFDPDHGANYSSLKMAGQFPALKLDSPTAERFPLWLASMEDCNASGSSNYR